MGELFLYIVTGTEGVRSLRMFLTSAVPHMAIDLERIPVKMSPMPKVGQLRVPQTLSANSTIKASGIFYDRFLKNWLIL